MRSRVIVPVLLSVIALSAATICAAPDEGHNLKTIGLRVLYVGHPGSAREKDFVDFLREYFKEVKTGDLANFVGRRANRFDVVILDYDGDGFKAPRPMLPESYTRPTVTVGVAGALMSGGMGLKTGYI